MELTREHKVPPQIEKIRAEAAKNPAFQAVCLVFAMRQRARQQVTMSRLKVIMAAEGYDFSTTQLEDVLKYLASCHIGTLDRDAKGRIRALKGIKVTLQSLGAAALTKQGSFERYSAQTRFIKLPVVKGEVPTDTYASVRPIKPETESPKVPPVPAEKAKRQYEAGLIVTIDGKDVKFELPKKVTMEDFFKILEGLYERV